MQQHVGY